MGYYDHYWTGQDYGLDHHPLTVHMTAVEPMPGQSGEPGEVAIEWDEPLRFAYERGSLDGLWQDGLGYEDDPLEDGTLTPEAVSAAEQVLTGWVPEGWRVYAGIGDEDEASLAITVCRDIEHELTEQDAADLVWPVVAMLANVTDPGTWNSPYLWSEVQGKVVAA